MPSRDSINGSAVGNFQTQRFSDKGEKKMALSDNPNIDEESTKKKRRTHNDDLGRQADLKSEILIKSGPNIVSGRSAEAIRDAEATGTNDTTPDDFREEHQLQVTGLNETGGIYISPIPMTSFAMTPFAQPIRKGMNQLGFMRL